mgnify:CR=1 FL=1
MRKVNPMPTNTINATEIVESRADIIEELGAINPLINMVVIVIRSGNLPLHGTKLLVKIAINLSRGELIILHPITPAALQPKTHTHC